MEKSRVIAQLYEASASPDGWPAALDDVATYNNAEGVIVFTPFAPPSGSGPISFPVSPKLVEPFSVFVREGWVEHDHRARLARPSFARRARSVLESDLISDAERRTMQVYHDFYFRFDLPEFAAILFYVDGMDWTATFARTRAQGAFREKDRRRLLSLQPHVERSIGLTTKLQSLHSSRMRIAVERLFPALLCVSVGKVTDASPEAEALLGADLAIKDGRLVTGDSRQSLALQEWLRRVCADAAYRLDAPTFVVRRMGRRPLVFDVLPIDDRWLAVSWSPRVLVAITDLDAQAVAAQDRVREVLGLTVAEAKLAVLLAHGMTIDECAPRLGLSRETVRTYLKKIFGKTDTHRQSELTALVLSLGRRPGPPADAP